MLLVPRPITLGKLNCLIVAPKACRATGLAVFCHGYGAPGDDLVSLSTEILHSVKGIALLFPSAPISLAEEGILNGRAWWPLNLSRLQMGLPLDMNELTEREPAGSAEATALLRVAIDECGDLLQLASQNIVLGGFSQGAMVAADCAFRSGKVWGGLCLLSGAPLRLSEWRREAEALSGRPGLLTHGRTDPVLPFSGAEAIRNTLTAAGMKVDFRPFAGGHTIPPVVSTSLPAFLRSACGIG